MTVAKNNIPTSRRKCLQKSINQTLPTQKKTNNKTSKNNWHFLLATAAVQQHWAECTNKIFINAAASPATDGNIGDNDDEGWQMGCCYRAEAKLSEYRWLRPSLRLTSQSEAEIWASWPIRGQYWVQPRSRSVTIFHSRDLSERHHNSRYTGAGRERQQHFERKLGSRPIYLIFLWK